MSQKDVVFNAVTAVVTIVDSKAELSKEEKKEVQAAIAAKLHSDRDTYLSKDAQVKYPTEDDLMKKYVPGLLNNWLRKDTRLNGGDKYQAKNPGSRAGSGDEQIREMNKLMKQFQIDPETHADKIKTLQAAIDERKKAIATEKQKSVTIDVSVLTPELREALGLATDEEVNAGEESTPETE